MACQSVEILSWQLYYSEKLAVTPLELESETYLMDRIYLNQRASSHMAKFSKLYSAVYLDFILRQLIMLFI